MADNNRTILNKNNKNMEKEIRNFNIEFKAAPESRRIEGRAIPFNVFSPNREGFREMISPSAVEGVFEKSDVFMLYNHDKSQGFLARSKKCKGSLRIETKEDGVYFNFIAGNDNLSNYIYDRVKSGDLDEMSWAFTVAEENWEKMEDGVYNRTISKFDKIYDLSIVDQSYYGIEGVVSCARFAEIQEADRLALEAAKAEEERKAQEEAEAKEAERKAKLDEYYKQLVEEYKQYMPEK